MTTLNLLCKLTPIEPASLGNIDRIEGDQEEAKIWIGKGSISLAVEARREQDGWKLGVLGAGLGMLALADGLGDRSRVGARLMETITTITGKPVEELWDPPVR